MAKPENPQDVPVKLFPIPTEPVPLTEKLIALQCPSTQAILRGGRITNEQASYENRMGITQDKAETTRARTAGRINLLIKEGNDPKPHCEVTLDMEKWLEEHKR